MKASRSPMGWRLLCWAVLCLGFSAGAQTPPAEFYTNLVNGATTLNLRFQMHSNRTVDFAVFVQTGAGSFANITLPPLLPGLAWTNRLALDGRSR
jgi:hypothetical protein